MNKIKKLLCLALLFMVMAFQATADDKVAIFVDQLWYNASGFSTALADYISEVEANFTNVDILPPYYDDYWSMDPITEIRAAIQAVRTTYNDLVGVILIGEIPLPLYQSFSWNSESSTDPDNDTPFYYPETLPYADLYGTFTDEWTLDANGKKLAGTNLDGLTDSWHQDTTMTEALVDIWVSIIRPTEEKYTLTGSAATFQAENGTLGTGGATPPPAIEADSNCDGGYKVINISRGRGNYLQFNNINGGSGGLFECKIYYKNIGAFQMSVNGNPGETVGFVKCSASTPEVLSIPVYLEDNTNNTIRFFVDNPNISEISMIGPDIDKIVLQQISAYHSDTVAEVVNYFEKCIDYYNSDLVIPNKALFFKTAPDFAPRIPDGGDNVNDGGRVRNAYGTANTDFNDPWFTTGQDLLDYLQNGYKFLDFTCHSDASTHAVNTWGMGPRPGFNSYSDAKDLIGSGASINIIGGCHSANMMEERDGCLVERYMHSPIGLVSIGITRSAYTFVDRATILADSDQNGISDNDMGTSMAVSYNLLYNEKAVKDGNEISIWDPAWDDPTDDRDKGPDRTLWGLLMLGNPFVYARDNFSATPATISGTVTNSSANPLPGVKVFAYKNNKVSGNAVTAANGTYTIPNLVAGTYNLTATGKNGDEENLTNITLTAGQNQTGKNFSFTPTKDIVTANDNWKYTMEYTTGTSWYGTGFNDSSWSEGKLPINKMFRPIEGGTSGAIGLLYVRKKFTIGENQNVHINISADSGINIYLNGTEYTANDRKANTTAVVRPTEKLFNFQLDYGDFGETLTDNAENLIAIEMWGQCYLDIAIYEDATASYTVMDYATGDFAGDNRIDSLRVSYNNGYTYLDVAERTSGGLGSYSTWAVTETYLPGNTKWLAGDFTGDGNTDILKIIQYDGEAYFHMFVSDGDSFTKEDWSLQNVPWESGFPFFVHDFNADGKMDIGFNETEKGVNDILIYFSTGTAFCGIEYETESYSNYVNGMCDYDKKDMYSGKWAAKVSSGTELEIRNIRTMVAGYYTLTMYYAGDAGTTFFYVNDATSGSPWSTSASATVAQSPAEVYLPAGTNKIRIASSSSTPYIDKIKLTSQYGIPGDIYFSEAEDAEYYSTSPAKVADSNCSDGYKVGDIGPSTSDWITFYTNIFPETGTHSCIINYTASADAALNFIMNTASPVHVIFPSTGGEVGTIAIDINVQTGYNTIYFYGNSAGEIEMDCIRIIKRSDSILDDSAAIRYEAESAINSFEGDAESEVDYGFSGSAKVTNIGVTSDDYMEFNYVYAGLAGEYLLTFVYTTTSDELLEISVNSGTDREAAFKNTAGSGMDELNVLVTLASGNNTIKLHQPSGGVSIELDYMEVTPYDELFTDDFETGTLDNWTVTGSAAIYAGTPHNGSYGAYLTDMGNIRKTSISTVGYSDIYLGFDLAAYALGNSAYFVNVQWYNGSSWQTAEQILGGDPEEQQAFTHYNFMLPSSAAGISDLEIIIVILAPGAPTSYGYVDDVVVAGKPTE